MNFLLIKRDSVFAGLNFTSQVLAYCAIFFRDQNLMLQLRCQDLLFILNCFNMREDDDRKERKKRKKKKKKKKKRNCFVNR